MSKRGKVVSRGVGTPGGRFGPPLTPELVKLEAALEAKAPSLDLLEKLRKHLEEVAPLAVELRGKLPDVSAGDLAAILSRRVTMAAHVHKVEGFVLGVLDQGLRDSVLTQAQVDDLAGMVRGVVHGR